MAAAIPSRYMSDPRIRWVGAVSRSEVMEHCRDSDVLVFPSHSDGFGMAQVEAQANRLPIIASRACGRVVQDGVNGLLLPEVSAAAIAAALRRAGDPALLTRFAAQLPVRGSSLDAFGERLAQLVH
jgi:glycosyltransferase involved in cell wall biosynthesis